MNYDLVVLFEHPEWRKPLFSALPLMRSLELGGARVLNGRERSASIRLIEWSIFASEHGKRSAIHAGLRIGEI